MPNVDTTARLLEVRATIADLEEKSLTNFDTPLYGRSRTKAFGQRSDARLRRAGEFHRQLEKLRGEEQELVARASYPARPARPTATAELLTTATEVAVDRWGRIGWWRVLRVNKTSVTVDAGDNVTMRLQFSKIVDWK